MSFVEIFVDRFSCLVSYPIVRAGVQVFSHVVQKIQKLEQVDGIGFLPSHFFTRCLHDQSVKGIHRMYDTVRYALNAPSSRSHTLTLTTPSCLIGVKQRPDWPLLSLRFPCCCRLVSCLLSLEFFNLIET